MVYMSVKFGWSIYIILPGLHLSLTWHVVKAQPNYEITKRSKIETWDMNETFIKSINRLDTHIGSQTLFQDKISFFIDFQMSKFLGIPKVNSSVKLLSISSYKTFSFSEKEQSLTIV
jgi:hypothetical protein